jgi:Concanavalin A-like lectin/glucanases superfamily
MKQFRTYVLETLTFLWVPKGMVKKLLSIFAFFLLMTAALLTMPLVATMYGVAHADLTDGLVAYYPFDGNANDQSGNNNNGVEYGGIQYKQGIIGDAASFDGVDDYIRVLSHPSLNPANQLSISFWVKVDGYTNEWSPIVHKGGPLLSESGTNREYTVWLHNTSNFCLASAGDGSAQNYLYACCAEVGWTHFVGIIDRQNHRMKIYVDGTLKVDANDPYATFNNNNYDLIIGWSEEVNSAYSPFKGRIDELRIYNRVLTEDEIKALSPVTTFDLWEKFPDNQGDNGFFAYGYAAATNTYWLLSDCGSYSFCRPEEPRWGNPHVFKGSGTGCPWLGEPWVGIWPSGTASNTGTPEDGVLAWVVPETAYYQLNGSFFVCPQSLNGVDVYIKQNASTLWASYLSPGAVQDFNVATLLLNAGETIYFGADAHNDMYFSEYNDWPYVKGQIQMLNSRPLLGDMNNDGVVDISDVILELRMALALDPVKPCSDINSDAAVDISDVILTLRMALALDPTRPCGG